MTRLKGKVAVVTGASKGIGASIARQLASEGAEVVVNYATSRDGAKRVVADIKGKGGKAVAIQADMAVESDIQRLFAEFRKSYDRLDILVNNAGVYEFAPLEDVTPAHFHRMFDLNVLGLMLASREAVKHFGAGGGSIINISSVVATSVLPMTSVYSSTKAAVDTLTRILAAERHIGEAKLGRRQRPFPLSYCTVTTTRADLNPPKPSTTLYQNSSVPLYPWFGV